MGEELIEVEITARQRVDYRQTKLIPKSVFDAYEKMCAENEGQYGDREFNEMFGDLIDPEDVCGSDDLENLEIVPTPTTEEE